MMLESAVLPLHDSEGRVEAVLNYLADITAQGDSNQSVVTPSALFDGLLRSGTEFICIKDPLGRYLGGSRAYASFVGVDEPGRLVGKSDSDFFSGEFARRAREDEEGIIRSGKGRCSEEELQLRSGRSRRVLTVKFPLKDRNQVVGGLFCLSIDQVEGAR
jgi:PAS domain-containing protein